MEKETDFEHEVEKRIEQMEAGDYAFPEAFGKADWIAAAAVIVLSGLFVIIGIWL